MIYLRKFSNHRDYSDIMNNGGLQLELPNVSYCEDVKDVHYLPYNLVRFYVGDITETTQQTVKIYTDSSNSIPIQVSKGNKWYTYALPKDKGLYKIEGDSVKNVVVKANITTSGETIIPYSTVEASFKGSSTSNVTNMNSMFRGCHSLSTIRMVGCSEDTINKIKEQLKTDGITVANIETT